MPKQIQFDLHSDLYESITIDDDLHSVNSTCSSTKAKKSSFFKNRFSLSFNKLKRYSDGDKPTGNKLTTLFSKKRLAQSNSKEHLQKCKLVDYLNTEKPIMRKRIEIDAEERELLDMLGNTHINLDKYLKMPKAEAKQNLWRIPYYFREDSLASKDDYNGPSSINRFGEGIQEGCMVTLSLPQKAKSKNTTWEDLVNNSEKILEQLEHSKMNQLRSNRRGSILQPRHLFLTPNPELCCEVKSFQLKKFTLLRDWSSQLSLDSIDQEPLLNSDFKLNICRNASMDDISHMLFPDLKNGFNAFSQLTNSEIEYIQAISNRRRQSLMPPNFEGQSDLSFRRQSLAGGQLWSTNVENKKKQAIYQQKLKLINPDHLSISTPRNCGLEHEKTNNNQTDANLPLYPELDYGCSHQAKLFAHELTLIVRQYFNSIKSFDIVNLMTNSSSNVLNTSTNIKALFSFKNRIIRLIASYILQKSNLEDRVQSILFFIMVIDQLKQLNNWHSVNLVTQSLQCPAVVRLKDTWRNITFNHAESYCFFIEISENLNDHKQVPQYKYLKRFIPIFEDVISEIKERCGLKLVQINQHRFHTNWGNSKNEHGEHLRWVNQQVNSLIQDVQQENVLKKQEKHSDKLSKISKLILLRRKSGKAQNQHYCERSDEEDDPTQVREEDENMNIYQRRLLAKNSLAGISRPNASTDMLPSCKKFWSITDYNKQRSSDKELIKQEMVRTLVMFQKKTFYVFEDRDVVIKDFLLNAYCYSMNVCMKNSVAIESSSKENNAPSTPTLKRAPVSIDQRNSVEAGPNNQVVKSRKKHVQFA